jgi:hypothetical protein
MPRFRSGPRRPLLLWLFALWLIALAATAIWRAAVLRQTSDLLLELGSTLSAPTLTLFVVLYTLSGAAFIVSAVGLWLRKRWGRVSSQAVIVLYTMIVQAYTWLFVRTGLLWERRWIALGLALGSTGITVGILTWHRLRQWLKVP